MFITVKELNERIALLERKKEKALMFYQYFSKNSAEDNAFNRDGERLNKASECARIADDYQKEINRLSGLIVEC